MGFAGGTKVNPTYRSLGDHTETVDVDYDPTRTDYRALLDIFWKNHDPTSKCTRQYMSAIFYHDEEQQRLAESTLTTQNKKKGGCIKTSIVPVGEFYVAEDYHQKYMLQRHPTLCHMLDVDPCGEELLTSHVLARLNGYVGGFGTRAAFEEEWPTLGVGEKVANYVRKNMSNKNDGLC